jgi:hypothetical protein
MSLPDPPISIAVVRREAEAAVAATSLRVVADEVGISAMSVRAFILAANQPQQRTLRKFNAWYARRAAVRRTEGMEDARAALIVLAGLYPEADRPRVLRNLVERMGREFHESRMPPPPWLAELAAEFGQGTG